MIFTTGIFMAVDFKSVGIKTTNPILQATPNETPIGIVTPLRVGQKNDGIFAMHTSLEDCIHDNFRNLMQTNYGERVGLYDFGANLRELSLELSRDVFENEAAARIKRSVTKYMPFINLRTLETNIDHSASNSHLGSVLFKITYDVPNRNILGKRLDVIIWVAGG